MTEDDEKLAALLDGRDEASASAIDAVADDVNLQYRLRRYRLIGEALRRELPPAIDTDFHAKVMARVRQEPRAAQAAPERRPRAEPAAEGLGRWRPFAGLAVAASVAILTVALWQPLTQPTVDSGATLAASDQAKIDGLAGQPPQGGAVPASTQIQSLGLRWKVDKEAPDLQQKLNAYLVNHTEYSNSVQGLIPQARVAGFDARQ